MVYKYFQKLNIDKLWLKTLKTNISKISKDFVAVLGFKLRIISYQKGSHKSSEFRNEKQHILNIIKETPNS